MRPAVCTLIAASIFTAAACATMQPDTPTLAGVWIVEDVNGGGIIDSSRIEIGFAAEDAVLGSAGCNRFNGSYEAEAGAITFGPLSTTRRACIPALNQQERRVLDALAAATSYTFDETGALILEGPTPHRLLARRDTSG